MTTSSWSFGVSWLTLLAGTLFVGLALWLFVLNARRNRGARGLLAIEGLKLLIVGLLVFTLFRPEVVRRSHQVRKPLVAVLCDASGSMATQDVVADGGDVQSRAAWLSNRVESVFWKPLEATYKVVVNEVALPGTADDPGTDLNLALEGVIESHNDLRAVLLLSDGDWNQGKPPVSAATTLRVRDIPLFAVTVGSDRFLPDLELQSVAAPAYGLMDEHISLPFTIQSRLSRDVKTTVTLRGPNGIEATTSVLVPAMAQLQESILFTPRVPGDFNFTLSLPVERDEVFKDNNARSFRMALRREVLKVLVVDSTPRWKYRFLHNALARDPGVSVHCLLLHPDMAAGEGKNYLPAFPASREALSEYDVVFLGDVGTGPDELSEQHLEMLKGLVEQQGSGLVFLPGIAGRQASLAGTPLDALMPVDMDERTSSGFGFNMESRLNLTARGRGHLLTMLAPDPVRNHAVWRRLPGFYWHAPVVRARSGSQVLAVHATARNAHGRLPLLVTADRGSGKVLFMGTDSAWRWRRGVEDLYHYRFWGQVVRWMAHQRHMAHEEGIRFFFSPEAPRRGDRVFLHTTVFDRSGFPLQEGRVQALIRSQGGHKETLELNPAAGGWGVFTGSFVPREGGTHDVAITCEAAARRVTAQIAVSSPQRERVGRPARSSVLSELAAVTRGRAGGIDELASIVENLSLLPEAKEREERLRLWCHPLWAGCIVALLALYWVSRKLMGLI
ncbi:MAG: hypothetical protein HN700_03875 [Verrucomicrobia bacterium]|nr:hypothetical protein [Verrucomicrobiota bacterium]